MPILAGYFEEVPYSLYDTLTITGARSARYCLFNTPVGQYGKTRAETNMQLAGCLPAPSYFSCNRFRMEILTGSKEDREIFRRTWIAEFVIGSKPYWSGPTSSLLLEDWLNKALKEIGDGDATPLPEIWERNLLNGFLGLGKTQEIIESCQAFGVFLSPENTSFQLSSDFSVRVFLDGTLYRAVQ